jgi:hypothetical protein
VVGFDAEGRELGGAPRVNVSADKGRFGAWKVAPGAPARIEYFGADAAGEKAKLTFTLADDPAAQLACASAYVGRHHSPAPAPL